MQNVELFVQALENCQVTRLFAVTSLVKSILSFVSMETKKTGLVKSPKLSKVPDVYVLGHFINDIFLGRFTNGSVLQKL